MKILAIETATNACSCAINIDGVISEKFVLAPQRHADLMLPMIDQLLAETSVALSAIDAIAFGAGPGGFMGVRIATGIAQGLGYALDRPLIPISTLQCLAQVGYQTTKNPHILAGWDAKMAAIYWGVYQLNAQGLMQPLVADCLTFPAEVKLPADHQQWLAVGNAWLVYQQELPWSFASTVVETRADLHPHAGAMALLAADKYGRGEMIAAEQAEPTYLRDEVAKKASKAGQSNI